MLYLKSALDRFFQSRQFKNSSFLNDDDYTTKKQEPRWKGTKRRISVHGVRLIYGNRSKHHFYFDLYFSTALDLFWWRRQFKFCQSSKIAALCDRCNLRVLVSCIGVVYIASVILSQAGIDFLSIFYLVQVCMYSTEWNPFLSMLYLCSALVRSMLHVRWCRSTMGYGECATHVHYGILNERENQKEKRHIFFLLFVKFHLLTWWRRMKRHDKRTSIWNMMRQILRVNTAYLKHVCVYLIWKCDRVRTHLSGYSYVIVQFHSVCLCLY